MICMVHYILSIQFMGGHFDILRDGHFGNFKQHALRWLLTCYSQTPCNTNSTMYTSTCCHADWHLCIIYVLIWAIIAIVFKSWWMDYNGCGMRRRWKYAEFVSYGCQMSLDLYYGWIHWIYKYFDFLHILTSCLKSLSQNKIINQLHFL